MDLVWEAARADYLNGFTVAQVCERHGVGRSAFYERLQASQSVRRNHRFRPPPDDILIEAPECDPNTSRFSIAQIRQRPQPASLPTAGNTPPTPPDQAPFSIGEGEWTVRAAAGRFEAGESG